jgi:hypothetical protein
MNAPQVYQPINGELKVPASSRVRESSFGSIPAYA